MEWYGWVVLAPAVVFDVCLLATVSMLVWIWLSTWVVDWWDDLLDWRDHLLDRWGK